MPCSSFIKIVAKVLAVDFDSQANFSTCFGLEDTNSVPVIIGHLMRNPIEDEEMADAKLRLKMGLERKVSFPVKGAWLSYFCRRNTRSRYASGNSPYLFV